MKSVSTYRELKSQLKCDGQGSGTLQGWVIFNGQRVFVRKHWSYEGGFPCYSKEVLTNDNYVGELFMSFNTSREYILNGVVQERHGSPLLDFDLIMKNEN